MLRPGMDNGERSSRAFEPLLVLSSDTHVGPRLVEDLRPYCPKKYLATYDDYVQQFNAYYAVMASNNPDMFIEIESGKRARPIRNLMTDGDHEISARLRDMNFDGVAGEVIFHGHQNDQPLPFSGLVNPKMVSSFKSSPPEDPELEALGRHMYNQWLADFCSVEPERHVGLAQIPIWDVEESVKEIKWARGAGLRGINFPSPKAWLSEYNKEMWEPLWAAATDDEMPLVTHISPSDADYSGTSGRPMLSFESAAVFGCRALGWMIYGGVFERHPMLRMAITETPGVWWSSLLDQLDSTYRLMFNHPLGDDPRLAELCPELPSEYCKRQLFIGTSFMSRMEVEDALNKGYDTNCMWGSDYPHAEGTYQFPVSWDETPVTRLAQRFTFAGLPEEPIRNILGQNAAEFYRFDVDRLLPVVDRINAPTLEELSEPVLDPPEGDRSYAFREHGLWD
jgi:predicted TIM-barrel fold metal-dependent hydrolase